MNEAIHPLPKGRGLLARQANSEPKNQYKAMIKEWVKSSGKQIEEECSEIYENYNDYSLQDKIEFLGKLSEGNEYGFTYSFGRSYDEIIKDLIQHAEKESRGDGDYYRYMRDVPSIMVQMAINDGKEKNDINITLSELERKVTELESEYDEDYMGYFYSADLWYLYEDLKKPEEDDYETKESYEKAEEEYWEEINKRENQFIEDDQRSYSRFQIPNEIMKILNNMREKGQYQYIEEKKVAFNLKNSFKKISMSKYDGKNSCRLC